MLSSRSIFSGSGKSFHQIMQLNFPDGPIQGNIRGACRGRRVPIDWENAQRARTSAERSCKQSRYCLQVNE